MSTITVSRALRGSKLVANSTRERILAAASELKYVPNLLARGLVENRSATLGVIIHEFTNPFFAPIVSAIEGIAARRELLVVIGESGGDEVVEQRYVERFQQLRALAIFVHPATNAVGHLDVARKRGTPIVVLARRWDDGDFVTVDNVEGGRLAGQHVLSRGHRRIGFVTSGDPDNSPLQDRISGFREVLVSADVSVPDPWQIRMPKTSFEDGQIAADGLLALSERPSAVFTVTDRLAMGMIHRLLECGIRVPDDIAIIGFDDMPYAAYAQVPLTTLAIPVHRMGELAAGILFEDRDGMGPGEYRQIHLQPELVIRASSP